MCTCVYLCVWVGLCFRLSVSIHLYKNMYRYIYRESDKEREGDLFRGRHVCNDTSLHTRAFTSLNK